VGRGLGSVSCLTGMLVGGLEEEPVVVDDGSLGGDSSLVSGWMGAGAGGLTS
jgi:hypothetical protein